MENTNSIPVRPSAASYDLEQQAVHLNKLGKIVKYLGRGWRWWRIHLEMVAQFVWKQSWRRWWMMLEDADSCLQVNFCKVIAKSNQGFHRLAASVNGGSSIAVALWTSQDQLALLCRLGVKAVVHDREPRFNSCLCGAVSGGGFLSFMLVHVWGGLMKKVELQEVKIALQSVCLRREVIKQSVCWQWSTGISSGWPGGPWGTGVYQQWSPLLWTCCLGLRWVCSVAPP